MKLMKVIALLLLCLGFARSAFAVPFLLETEAATKVAGTLNSPFYQVSSGGVELLGTTAVGLFTSTLGGNDVDGFWVNISFGGNPQPILTSAFLKASNAHLLWDSSDLLAFNAGDFDSITLWNRSVANDNNVGLRNGNNKFHNIGHAGLMGTLGEAVVDVRNNVPDASSTLAMLGLGMIGLFVAARRRASK